MLIRPLIYKRMSFLVFYIGLLEMLERLLAHKMNENRLHLPDPAGFPKLAPKLAHTLKRLHRLHKPDWQGRFRCCFVASSPGTGKGIGKRWLRPHYWYC